MLRNIKKYMGITESRVRPEYDSESDSESDSMEDVDPQTPEDVLAEAERNLEYEIVRVEESKNDLENVKCICVKCGEDFTEDVMNGETEVVKVRRIKNMRSSSGSSTPSDEEQDRRNTVLSPEGFCLDCEIKEHPDRFHGCGFCRRPLRDLFACTTCRIGFSEWIKEAIPPETIMLSSVRKQAKKIVMGIVGSGYLENREFLYQESQLMGRWPGFYAGPLNVNNNGKKNDVYLPTWIIPELLRIPDDMKSLSISTDLTHITKFELFEKKLLEILEYNNIHIYHNVQIDVTKLKGKDIREVNPYDTSILS